jgi:hypothetical protein
MKKKTKGKEKEMERRVVLRSERNLILTVQKSGLGI